MMEPPLRRIICPTFSLLVLGIRPYPAGDLVKEPRSATSASPRSLSEIDFGSPQIKSQDFGEEGGVDY